MKPDKKTTRLAKRIIRALKGWDAKQEAEDRRDHPEAHAVDLQWTENQLRRYRKGQRRNNRLLPGRECQRLLCQCDRDDHEKTKLQLKNICALMDTLHEQLIAARADTASLRELLVRAASLRQGYFKRLQAMTAERDALQTALNKESARVV